MKPHRTRTTRTSNAERLQRLGFKLFSVAYEGNISRRARIRIWALDACAAMDFVEKAPYCHRVIDAHELKRQPKF